MKIHRTSLVGAAVMLVGAASLAGLLAVSPARAGEPDLSGLEAVRAAYIAVWLTTPLAVSHVTLTEGEAGGMGQYTIAASNSFKRGAPIHVYAEITGYHWKSVPEGGFMTEMEADLSLKTPDGAVVASQPKFFHAESRTAQQNLEQFLSFTVTLSAFAPGDYVLFYQLTDKVSGEAATFDVPVVLTP